MEGEKPSPVPTEYPLDSKAEILSKSDRFFAAAEENFSQALAEAYANGELFEIFPELGYLERVDQRPDYHTEGDVLRHSLMAVEAVPEKAPLEVKFAALFHDLGKLGDKPLDVKGRDQTAMADPTRFYAHEKLSIQYLTRIIQDIPEEWRGQIDSGRVLRLVADHMKARVVEPDKIKDSTIARYFLDDPEYGRDLMTLMVADLRASVRESDPEGKKQDAYIRDLKDRVVEVRCLRELREERLTQLRERGLVGEKEKLYTAAPHVAYIENTPNPASALAYYLNTRAGFIAPNCWLIPKYSGVTDQGPKDAIGKSLFARGELSPASLASLAKGNPHLQSVCRYLQAWGVPPESRLSWLSKQDQGWPPDFMKMIDACTLININDPVAFVKQICQLLDYIKTKHIDVRRLSGEDLDGLRDSFSHLFRDIAELSDVVSGRRPIEYRENVAIPKYERGELIDPTNKAEFDINTGNVVLLGGEHLVIAIGGSPNVGKSTFAASLAEALKAELARISQIPELGDIYLEVGLVDVDRATPVSSQLAEGRKMEEGPKKQSWNRALAAEAARELFKISKSANITVADFPGGKPDQITRALVGSVDAAVVLARENWEEIMPVWTSFFKEGGVPVIGKFRSHKMGDVTSAGHTIFEDGDLRTYNPGRFISGRVVGLERQLKPHDPLIVNTARLVLADLLPSMIGRRNQKRQNIVNGIKAAYGIE